LYNSEALCNKYIRKDFGITDCETFRKKTLWSCCCRLSMLLLLFVDVVVVVCRCCCCLSMLNGGK